ncbi:MAG: hypothetical protein ACXABY_10155 [Candidatus Thorarchaeota archaeon]|jgi:hypothetical protein
MALVTYRSCNPVLRERINACVRMINAVAFSITPAGIRKCVEEIFKVRMARNTVTRILIGEL